jgi:hypothetical protein
MPYVPKNLSKESKPEKVVTELWEFRFKKSTPHLRQTLSNGNNQIGGDRPDNEKENNAKKVTWKPECDQLENEALAWPRIDHVKSEN